MANSERRKTAHLTEGFREYVKREMSKVTGLELDDNQSWTIFKLAFKLPMRFLPTISEEDLDKRGEKAISVPGVGKFKYRMTIPQGKKDEQGNVTIDKNTMADGTYPRYKYYPAASIENEVEFLHGIAKGEVLDSYNKMIASESKHIERTAAEIAKMVSKNAAPATTSDKKDSLEESIKKMVEEAIKKAVEPYVGKNSESIPNEDLDEDLKDIEDIEDDDDEESGENTAENVDKENAEPTSKPETGKDSGKVDDFDFDFDS